MRSHLPLAFLNKQHLPTFNKRKHHQTKTLKRKNSNTFSLSLSTKKTSDFKPLNPTGKKKKKTEALLCLLDLVTHERSILLWGGSRHSANDLNATTATTDERRTLLLEVRKWGWKRLGLVGLVWFDSLLMFVNICLGSFGVVWWVGLGLGWFFVGLV